MTEAQKRAQKKYDEATKDKRRFVYLKLNKETDADIIQKLDEVDNIQGYIKSLIRADMGIKKATGHWKWRTVQGIDRCKCSKCNCGSWEMEFNYCPYCGTKMKK